MKETKTELTHIWFDGKGRIRFTFLHTKEETIEFEVGE